MNNSRLFEEQSQAHLGVILFLILICVSLFETKIHASGNGYPSGQPSSFSDDDWGDDDWDDDPSFPSLNNNINRFNDRMDRFSGSRDSSFDSKNRDQAPAKSLAEIDRKNNIQFHLVKNGSSDSTKGPRENRPKYTKKSL